MTAALHVYRGETDSIVGESLEDAQRAYAEFIGSPVDSDEVLEQGFEELPDDRALTLIIDDEGDTRVTKSCAEWARENGRGFLASTEW